MENVNMENVSREYEVAVGISVPVPRQPKIDGGSNESMFLANFEEYKKIAKSIRSLKKSMQRHLEQTRKQMASSAALAVELSYFHHNTNYAKNTLAFGQLHTEIERIQLASVEKLYQTEVEEKTEQTLWKYDNVISGVKERKKMQGDYYSQRKKYDDKLNQLKDYSNDPKRGNGMLNRKRKTEEELVNELKIRAEKVEQVVTNLDNKTEWLMKMFNDMIQAKKSGTLLSGPMAAVVSCQSHLLKETSKRMEKIKTLFPDYEVFNKTLKTYDDDVVRGIQKQELDHGRGAVFGKRITSVAPAIMCDCIEFIKQQGISHTEGLFRIPGKKVDIEAIKAKYDEGAKGAIKVFGNADVHVVCGLLKLWLRKLPEPLIPYEQYHQLLNAVRENKMAESDTLAQRIVAIADSIHSPNREALGMLMNFLREISKHSSTNSMNVSNLSTCIAPTVARSDDTSPQAMMYDLHPTINAVSILITNASKLKVPPKEEIVKNTHIGGLEIEDDEDIDI